MAVSISWFNILFFRNFSDYKKFRNILLKCAGVGRASQVNAILNYEVGRRRAGKPAYIILENR
jgi:endonuclease III-like uncharacterized protein